MFQGGIMKGFKYIVLGMLLSTKAAFAVSCYVTVVKGSCWVEKFSVTVKVVDVVSKQELSKVTIPAGKSWERASFACNPGQQLQYLANYSPKIWDGDVEKIFESKRFTTLPLELKPTDLAWNIPICFSDDFKEVTNILTGDGKCGCDFKSVPPLKL
jgi:hypothetical protein